MITTPAGTSMNLEEAAAFLGLHPNTLQERAKTGEIPGVKIGKTWRFLAERLVDYMKSKEKGESERCRSTKEMEVPIGGIHSQTPMGADELENQLENLIDAKRKKSMTGKRRNSGKSKLRVISSTMP